MRAGEVAPGEAPEHLPALAHGRGRGDHHLVEPVQHLAVAPREAGRGAGLQAPHAQGLGEAGALRDEGAHTLGGGVHVAREVVLGGPGGGAAGEVPAGHGGGGVGHVADVRDAAAKGLGHLAHLVVAAVVDLVGEVPLGDASGGVAHRGDRDDDRAGDPRDGGGERQQQGREGEQHPPRAALAEVRHHREVCLGAPLGLLGEGLRGVVLRVVQRADSVLEHLRRRGTVSATHHREELGLDRAVKRLAGLDDALQADGTQPGVRAPADHRGLEGPTLHLQVAQEVRLLWTLRRREARHGRHALADVQRGGRDVGEQRAVIAHREHRRAFGAQHINRGGGHGSAEREGDEDGGGQEQESGLQCHKSLASPTP